MLPQPRTRRRGKGPETARVSVACLATARRGAFLPLLALLAGVPHALAGPRAAVGVLIAHSSDSHANAGLWATISGDARPAEAVGRRRAIAHRARRAVRVDDVAGATARVVHVGQGDIARVQALAHPGGACAIAAIELRVARSASGETLALTPVARAVRAVSRRAAKRPLASAGLTQTAGARALGRGALRVAGAGCSPGIEALAREANGSAGTVPVGRAGVPDAGTNPEGAGERLPSPTSTQRPPRR